MRCADIFLAFPVRAVRCRHDRRYRPWSSERLYRHRHSWLAFDCARFRSAILTVKENDYVDAARAMGASDARIVVRHIFPNSVASIVVYATMNIGGAILTESALSFLGMGVIPPTPRGAP